MALHSEWIEVEMNLLSCARTVRPYSSMRVLSNVSVLYSECPGCAVLHFRSAYVLYIFSSPPCSLKAY